MTEPDKSVFAKTNDETPSVPKAAVERLTQDTKDTGLYESYPAGKPNQFIHEFVTGRKILIEVDPDTGKEYFLRDL